MFNPSVNNVGKGVAHKKAIAEVTKWVNLEISQQEIDIGKYQAMVTEIQCNEPDCVPIETLIMIMLTDDLVTTGKDAEKWADKIMKPVAEVTRDDVSMFISNLFLPTENEVSNEMEVVGDAALLDKLEGELRDLMHTYDLLGSKVIIQALQKQIEQLANDTTTVSANIVTDVPETITPPVTVVTMVPMKPNRTQEQKQDAPTKNLPIDDTKMAPGCIPTSAVEDLARLSTPSSSSVKSAGASVPTVINMAPTAALLPAPAPVPAPIMPVVTYTTQSAASIAPRHKKGSTRPRGCPCCDPDNLDNIIDTMMFSHYPQT